MFAQSIEEFPSTHPALLKLRKVAAETCLRAASEPLIRVVGVGMPFTKRGFHGERPGRDLHNIQRCIRDLARLNISVSEDFVFIPMDLRFGQNFHTPVHNLNADIVMISVIAKSNNPERSLFGRRDKETGHFITGRITGFDIPPYFLPRFPFVTLRAPHFRESPEGNNNASWTSAVERSRAKAVVSFGGKDEIDVREFSSPLYIDATYETPAHRNGYTITHPVLLRKDYAAHLGM